MSTIADRQRAVVERFAKIADWEDRYREIMAMGKSLAPLDEQFKCDKYQVRGCQSQVWLHAALEGDKVVFRADGDAAIVRGLIALLLEVFSGATPDEIVAASPTFIDQIGLSQHLSQSRANGIAATVKQIKLYALALQAMASGRKLPTV